MIPQMYNLSTAPAGSNPYSVMQATLISNLKMYPVFSSSYPKRVAGLLAVLVYTIFVSAIYLGLTLRATKRESIWFARFAHRPAGRYLALNQFLLYPIATIILSCIWIAYVVSLYEIWGKRQKNIYAFYWMSLVYLPFYLHLWTTTFAVLSGANLSSRGRKAGTHFLSPLVANSLYLLLLPLIMLLLIGFGITSGRAWFLFSSLWQNEYDALGQAAATWDVAIPAVDPAVQAVLSNYIAVRGAFMIQFIVDQHNLLIVCILSSSVLIAINLIGGISLLVTIRRMLAGPQLDEPAASAPSRSSGLALSSASPPSSNPTSSSMESSNRATRSPSLLKLEFDITLFFVTVPIVLVLWIAFSSWATMSMRAILSTGNGSEIGFMGFIWLATVFAAITMTILTFSTFVFQRQNSSTSTASHSDPSSGTIPRSARHHVLQLGDTQLDSKERNVCNGTSGSSGSSRDSASYNSEKKEEEIVGVPPQASQVLIEVDSRTESML